MQASTGTKCSKKINNSWPIQAATFMVALLFCLCSDQVVAAPRESVRVIHVDDGDTVIVQSLDSRERSTIRLTDIDAPEIGHGQSRPGQPFGRKAKAAMAQMVEQKVVELECYPGETYGRRICRVFVNGVDAGERLVAMGLAWAYRDNPRYVRDPRIYSVEQAAQSARLGLWSYEQSQPPWIWRRACWQRQECPQADQDQ